MMYIKFFKKRLEQEWEAGVGDDVHKSSSGVPYTSPKVFSELVAKAVIQRLQLTCGLETKQYYSFDGDEIICTVKSDDNDLRIEAARSQYLLQTRLKPFSKFHKDQDDCWKRRHHTDYIASMEYLSRTMDPDNPVTPEMDPSLFRKKLHPPLISALNEWGHNTLIDEKDDGHAFITRDGIVDDSITKRLKQWWHSLQGLNRSRENYFAPYAPYVLEGHMQPYYRRYRAIDIHGNEPDSTLRMFNTSLKNSAGHQFSLFRDVDRIRLVTSIIKRHINTDSLKLNGGWLKAYFGLHNKRELTRLEWYWAKSYRWCELWGGRDLPLLDIRNYYGEQLGLYFAFLEFFTKMLIAPSVIGIFVYVSERYMSRHPEYSSSRAFLLCSFGVFITLWGTVYTELWKRKNAVLTLWWGTIDLKTNQTARPQFLGKQRLHPARSALRRSMFISWVIVAVLLSLAIAAILLIFQMKDYFKNQTDYPLLQTAGPILCGLINAGQISAMNYMYKVVSRILTRRENQRTETDYESSFIAKAFVFQFVNTYFSVALGCIYVAFIKINFTWAMVKIGDGICRLEYYDKQIADLGIAQSAETAAAWKANVKRGHCTMCELNPSSGVPDCLAELQLLLGVLMITRFVFMNPYEAIRGTLWYKLMLFMEKMNVKDRRKRKLVTNAKELYDQAEFESKMHNYDDFEFFDDYNEIILNYGFVTLFVVAFPMGPLLCFLNNVLEVHVDAFKLTTFRRPEPNMAEDIGTWFHFTGVLSTASVVSNVGLLCFTSDLLDGYDGETKLWIFLLVENTILFIRNMVERLVPDMPQRVITFYRRQQLIIQKVFYGMHAREEINYEEQAEKYDVRIQENPLLWQFEHSLQAMDASALMKRDAKKKSKVVV